MEPIPAYIYIPGIDVEVDPSGNEGSNAQDISDAWVYVGGQLIGVFEMPSTIPVLADGEEDIVIIAGVKTNGQSNDRRIYPFYSSFDKVHNFVPAQVDTIRPKVNYRNAEFVWLEDFEDNTISLEKSETISTTDSFFITSDSTEVFEYDGSSNRFSGKIVLPADGIQVFENRSVDLFDLPRRGEEVFLELNFACNTAFTVGIYPIRSSTSRGIPIVNFFSTVDDETGEMKWKKGYLSLKEDVSTPANQGADFKVFINAQTNVSTGSPQILLDNIKLIHF